MDRWDAVILSGFLVLAVGLGRVIQASQSSSQPEWVGLLGGLLILFGIVMMGFGAWRGVLERHRISAPSTSSNDR